MCLTRAIFGYPGGKVVIEVTAGRVPRLSVCFPQHLMKARCGKTGGDLGAPRTGVGGLREASQAHYWVRAMAASEMVPDRWQLGTGGRKPVAFGGTSAGFSEACAVSVLFCSNFPVSILGWL